MSICIIFYLLWCLSYSLLNIILWVLAKHCHTCIMSYWSLVGQYSTCIMLYSPLFKSLWSLSYYFLNSYQDPICRGLSIPAFCHISLSYSLLNIILWVLVWQYSTCIMSYSSFLVISSILSSSNLDSSSDRLAENNMCHYIALIT